MSDISRWWTQSATIQRLTTSGNVDTYQAQSALIACLIQAFEPTRQDYLAQTLFKPHRMWCALDADIKEDDIVLQSGKRYTVRGIVKREQGNNPHLEILLEQAVGS